MDCFRNTTRFSEQVDYSLNVLKFPQFGDYTHDQTQIQRCTPFIYDISLEGGSNRKPLFSARVRGRILTKFS